MGKILNHLKFFSEGASLAPLKSDHYLRLYETLFQPMVDKEIHFLELGVNTGESLEMFAEYFENAHIYGIDLKKSERRFSTERIKFYEGGQDDASLYERILSENKIQNFDVIVDDCSHIGDLTLSSFKILFPLLKNGGYYIIEDWGTGYWPWWPGGKAFDFSKHLEISKRENTDSFESHPYGMPGVLKQLIDEISIDAIAFGLKTTIKQDFGVKGMRIYPGIAAIEKQ